MSGCPGSKTIDFSEKTNQEGSETGKRPSQLRQWPIQMHLVSPMAPYFREKTYYWRQTVRLLLSAISIRIISKERALQLPVLSWIQIRKFILRR